MFLEDSTLIKRQSRLSVHRSIPPVWAVHQSHLHTTIEKGGAGKTADQGVSQYRLNWALRGRHIVATAASDIQGEAVIFTEEFGLVVYCSVLYLY